MNIITAVGTKLKGSLTLKLVQLIKYYIRIFIEKYADNVHHKLIPDLYSILVKSSKFRQYMQEIFLKRHLEREFSKILKKSHFIFVFEPGLFLWVLFMINKMDQN